MEVSNADRVVFPDDGITKGEVVDYYRRVAERMLPFVEGRALSVERFPRGVGAPGFMQKNVPDHYPDDLIRRFEVPKEGGGTTVYPVVDSAEGIAFYANLGVITFHVPPVKAEDEDRPDWAVWDLDPPPGRVDLVRAAAGEMRSILGDHGIPTLPMTSGSKGYHLRARVAPTVDIASLALVAHGTAALAASEHDDLLTVAFRKAERGDRVFIDWLRNTSRSTSVVPWSLRPRAGAPIAAPLAWEEVEEVEPDQVRLESVEGRLDADPWAEAAQVDLSPVVETVQRSLDAEGIELAPFDRFRS
jgi:bifunctional non-homologous end joining protein LigD